MIIARQMANRDYKLKNLLKIENKKSLSLRHANKKTTVYFICPSSGFILKSITIISRSLLPKINGNTKLTSGHCGISGAFPFIW